MSKTNSNSSAFPIPPTRFDDVVSEEGVTKLEYFAGLALQGMLANNQGLHAALLNAEKFKVSPTQFLAGAAVDHAKALLEALEKA